MELNLIIDLNHVQLISAKSQASTWSWSWSSSIFSCDKMAITSLFMCQKFLVLFILMDFMYALQMTRRLKLLKYISRLCSSLPPPWFYFYGIFPQNTVIVLHLSFLRRNCVCTHRCSVVHVWLEDNVWKLLFSFHRVYPRNLTWPSDCVASTLPFEPSCWPQCCMVIFFSCTEMS